MKVPDLTDDVGYDDSSEGNEVLCMCERVLCMIDCLARTLYTTTHKTNYRVHNITCN